MSNIFGNTPSCLDSAGHNLTDAVLLVKVLPFLVNGLLYGGIPPYVIHISNSKRQPQGKAFNSLLILISFFAKLLEFDIPRMKIIKFRC